MFFSLIHTPLLLAPNTPNYSIYEKSDMKMKLMMKIKNVLFRSQKNAIIDFQCIFAIILSYSSTSTSNCKTKSRTFFTHTYPLLVALNTQQYHDNKSNEIVPVKRVSSDSHKKTTFFLFFNHLTYSNNSNENIKCKSNFIDHSRQNNFILF